MGEIEIETEVEAKLKEPMYPDTDKGDEHIGLKPKMTLLNGVTVIVGSIIGSGIFVSPAGVLKNTGSVNMSLIVWTLSGVFSMIGAYCYAELGTMIRKSGADYAYIMATFGPFLAFVRLWIECMIVRPCSQSIVALTFSLYVLRPFFPDCDPPEESIQLLSICCICKLAGIEVILTFINCWDVKWATKVQDIFTIAKLLALFIIIATGGYQLLKGHIKYFTFDNTKTEITSLALSFYSGLFAYNGWNYLNFITEELKNPVKNLPLAIYISCTLVTIVYVLTNIAFYTTLSPSELLESEAVAVSFADKLFGQWAFIIPIFVALSTFGAVNGVLLTSSRLFYSGACQGQMPKILTMVQLERSTPVPAVLIMALLSIVYLGSSDIFALINYVGFVTWLSIGVTILCLPWLRWTKPHLERPIKVHLFWPIIYLLATIFIVTVPMMASPKETGIGVLMILSSIPVYWIFVKGTRKNNILSTPINGFTKLFQKLILVLRNPIPVD